MIALSPALASWRQPIDTCGQEISNTILFMEELPWSSLDLQKVDFYLRLGLPGSDEMTLPTVYIAQIGWEQIEVIANRANPMGELDSFTLNEIFTGKSSTWEGISQSGESIKQPIQVWVYPESDEVRHWFEAVILPGESPTTQALLAPGAPALVEAIAQNQGAVGYLPGSWLSRFSDESTSEVKVIALEEELATQLRQPVLAFAASEPQGVARALLACLQSLDRR